MGHTRSIGGMALVTLVACNALLGIEDKSLRDADADALPPGDGGLPTTDGALATYRDLVLGDRPVAYLRLGEPQGGTTARNEITSQPQHDGTYPSAGVELGVPGALSGTSDTAVRLEGARFVAIPEWDQVRFAGTAAFSVEAWVRPAESLVEYGYVVDHETFEQSPGKSGWALIVGRSEVYLERWEGGENRGTVSSGSPLASSVWHHIVGTYDGAAETMYVDGNWMGTTPSAQAIVSPIGSRWAIGGQNCACTVTNFSGDLDEVAVYDHALTPERIKLHFERARR